MAKASGSSSCCVCCQMLQGTHSWRTRSYDQYDAHPLSKATLHREWSFTFLGMLIFTFLKVRKLQPKSSHGTASISSQKGSVGGRNGGIQAVFGKTWMYYRPHTPMVTKTVNGWPDHWLSALQMVADFYLTFTFFLKTEEVPQVPFLQRLRKHLGGEERDQPPFCAYDLSWTHSRVAWRANSQARPLPKQNVRVSYNNQQKAKLQSETETETNNSVVD